MLAIPCISTFKRTMKSSLVFSSKPRSITIVDLNNDHLLDIIVANYGIFLGYGNGSFGYLTAISLGPSRPIFVTTDDFNNDYQVDITVVNSGTNSIGILLGYGNASFQNYQIYSTSYDSYPSSFAVSDFQQ